MWVSVETAGRHCAAEPCAQWPGGVGELTQKTSLETEAKHWLLRSAPFRDNVSPDLAAACWGEPRIHALRHRLPTVAAFFTEKRP